MPQPIYKNAAVPDEITTHSLNEDYWCLLQLVAQLLLVRNLKMEAIFFNLHGLLHSSWVML